MELKSNELRIGNWVDNGVGQNYIIDTSWFMDILNFAQVNGKTDLKPIPLTEEWLIKFGFEWMEETAFYHDKHHCVGIYTSGIIEFHPFCTNDEDCQIKIKYVHQLQNLFFALCQKDLTIKE